MVDGPVTTRRPLGMGEVLDGGFRLFRASLVRCVPYAALAALAGQLPSAYDLAAGHPLRGFGTTDPLWWSIYVAATCVSFVMWSAVLLHQQRIGRGERLGTVAEVGDACRRLPSILGLVAPLALVTVIVLRLGSTTRLLLVLPAVYLATALSMSWPALLLERRGPLAACRRSLALVAGHWWRTTALLAASAVIVIVFYALGGVLGAFVTLPVAWLKSVVLLLLASLAVPLYSALLLAVYSDLNSPRSRMP